MKKIVILSQNFYQRVLEHKSAYFVVSLFIVVASFATCLIVAEADDYYLNQYAGTSISGGTNGAVDNDTGTGSQNNQSGSQNKNRSKSNGQSASLNGASGNSGSTGSSSDDFSTSVIFYGDSQSDTDEEDIYHSNVVGAILSAGGNPIFHAGDLLEDGTEASLNRFNSVTSTLRGSRTFYAAQGNNERDSSVYFDNFEFPGNERWYSINSGNLHMIVLDSAYSSTSAGSAQYNWLISDLQSSTSQSKITGVIFHHPPYGSGGDTKGLMGTIVPLFRDYGVDFVVSGHEHLYQKRNVDGIYYFVTSGQPSIGFLKADIYTNTISITAYSNGGGVVDSVRFVKR